MAGGVACATYPDAVGMALKALELEPGSRVVVSALSPAFYLEELSSSGLEPLVVDVEEACGCMAPALALDAARDKGADAMLIHYPLGYIPDIEQLLEAEIPIIEDITTAFGGNDGTRLSGTGGDYCIIGLEPEHLLTAGGGALLLASGRRQYTKLKQVVENASRSRLMPDMCAALALVQFRESEGYFERRKELASIFSKAVMKSRHRVLIQSGEGENVHFSLPLMIESSVKDVSAYARKKGVETSLAFADSLLECVSGDFPIARQFMLRCLVFPLYPTLGRQQAEQIAKVLSTLP
jgi:dTDP-4-amino-4,6-dideoxygalactose transaminase